MAQTTRQRLRMMADDQPTYYQDKATGDGAGSVFFLSHYPAHPNAGTAGTVSLNGTVQTVVTHYTLDWQHGRVTFGTAPLNNGTVQVDYLAATLTDDEVDDAYVYAGGSANLQAAAAELWRIKAGRHAKHYTFGDSGGASFSRSDWAKACLQMAEIYQKQSAKSAAARGVWVGGVSVDAKQTQEEDSDRVGARFKRGQFENPGQVQGDTDLDADD